MAFRPQDQTVRAPRRANMGRTKAWQPTDKLTKKINTTAIQDEQMMMIHVGNLKKGRVLSMFF